jgi:hypothetical protein
MPLARPARRSAGNLLPWASPRHVLALLLAPLLMGAPCGTPLPSFPALLASLPANGAANVSVTAWLRFTFAASIAGVDRLALECNGNPVTTTNTILGTDEAVLNPTADLPAGAPCVVSWLGDAGPSDISFTTAAAGTPATLLYDRTDPRNLAPLPDDLLLTADPSTGTGQRVDVTPPTIPGGPFEQALINGLIGAANQADGWSPVGFFSAEISDALDPASLPLTPQDSLDPLASVGWFDLTPGSPTLGDRIPVLVQQKSNLDPNTGLTHHTLLVFPSIRLTPTGRYGIVVTRRAGISASRPLDPSASFASVLGDFQGSEPQEVTDARAITDALLAEIAVEAELPFDAQDIAMALRLTVRSDPPLAADMLALRAAVDALPAPTLTIGTTSASPYPGIALEVRGTFDPPEFRNLGSGLLNRDVGGTPTQNGNATVPFVMALPDASLSGPAPLIMYQHGNPGSAEEVPGNLGGLASTTGNTLADEGFAMIGFTDAVNREVGQDLGLQANAIILTIMARVALPAYDIQSWSEQVALVKMLQALGTLDLLPLPSGDGTPDLDVSTLLYLGISQGAVKGSATMAYLPEIRAAALTAGGARNGEVLVHQAEFLGILNTLQATLPLLTPSEIWTGFVGYQMGYDTQEPHNHAHYLYQSPHPLGVPERASLLVTEGIGDSIVPNHGTRALVHTLGPVLQVEPIQEASPVVTSVVGPLSANVNATTTAGYYQYVPTGIPGLPNTPGCMFEPEGHFCPQIAPEAIRQRIEFFQSALSGPAPVIIDPLVP